MLSEAKHLGISLRKKKPNAGILRSAQNDNRLLQSKRKVR